MDGALNNDAVVVAVVAVDEEGQKLEMLSVCDV